MRLLGTLFFLLSAAAFGQDSAPAADAAAAPAPHRHVRLAGFAVGAGYSHGPAFYPGYYYGPAYAGAYYPGWMYDPLFLTPYVHPGFLYGFAAAPDRGEVKLLNVSKDAEVYLDSAYAGQASKLKTMWLEPGVHELELRNGTTATYQKRIYVLSSKTLKLNAAETR